MAMAFLFSSLVQPRRDVQRHLGPGVCAIVIDHQLRPGSAQEASRVVEELKRLGLQACIRRLSWSHVKDRGLDPAHLSNLEGMARTMRYQALGLACRSLRATSLFFAHHRDDQYETILMRILAGHGYRGLRGIQEANAIPECYQLHGVYKSTMMDHPPQPGTSHLRPHSSARNSPRLEVDYKGSSGPPVITQDIGTNDPDLKPLECEDGGVVVYRPLLDFDKDRLIATCEANKVQWFEDYTNLDPTLTTRNSIRHLVAAHQLPMALRKPAIFSLSKRAKRRMSAEEAEAHRLLVREAVVRRFDSNVGTLLVQIPAFRANRIASSRRLASARREARRRHWRLIFATATRKLIDMVMPGLHLPPPTNLEQVVDRISPGLCLEPCQQPEKAFSIAGVLFEPIVGPASTEWLLSRAPYPSSKPRPMCQLSGSLRRGHEPRDLAEGEAPIARRGRWRSWETAQLWDGRFWIQLRSCAPATFQILPLLPQHTKPFRLALPREERFRLERVLKRRAPAKLRYSLPALYSVQDAEAGSGTAQGLTLLALPSLGIHVPGLERWVKYEARYKKIDRGLLGRARRDRARHHVGRGCSGRTAMRHGRATPYLSSVRRV